MLGRRENLVKMELIRRIVHAANRLPEARVRFWRKLTLKLIGIDLSKTISVLYAPNISKQICGLERMSDSGTIATKNSHFGFQLEHHFDSRNKIQLKEALVDVSTGNVFLKSHISKSWELVVETSEWPIETRITFAKMPSTRSHYKSFKGVFVSGLITSSYYHQITEDIPSLLLIHKNQKIVSRERDSSLLSFFGLTNLQIVEEDNFVLVEKLDVLTKGRDVGYLHPQSRELLLKQVQDYMKEKAFRKVYLSRLNMRRTVPGELSIIEYLKSRNFEIVDSGSLSIQDQVKIFSEAKIVVAPHGGAITNMIFSKNARLLELMPNSRINRCFEWQSHICGHNYQVIVYDDKRGVDLNILASKIDEISRI